MYPVWSAIYPPRARSAVPAWKGGMITARTGDWCRRTFKWCLTEQTHCIPSAIEGSVSELQKLHLEAIYEQREIRFHTPSLERGVCYERCAMAGRLWGDNSEDENLWSWARTETASCWADPKEQCWLLPPWDLNFWISWPSLSFTVFRIKIPCAGHRCACIIVEIPQDPKKSGSLFGRKKDFLGV